jgi:hypothetical protein
MSPRPQEIILKLGEELQSAIDFRMGDLKTKAKGAIDVGDFGHLGAWSEQMQKLGEFPQDWQTFIDAFTKLDQKYHIGDIIVPGARFADLNPDEQKMAISVIAESIETGEAPKNVMSKRAKFLLATIALDDKGKYKFNTFDDIFISILSPEELKSYRKDNQKLLNLAQAKSQFASAIRKEKSKGAVTVADAISHFTLRKDEGTDESPKMSKFYRIVREGNWGKMSIDDFIGKVLNRFEFVQRGMSKKDVLAKNTPEKEKISIHEQILNTPATERCLAAALRFKPVRQALSDTFLKGEDAIFIAQVNDWYPKFLKDNTLSVVTEDDFLEEMENSILNANKTEGKEPNKLSIQEQQNFRQLLFDGIMDMVNNYDKWDVIKKTNYSAWSFLHSLMKDIGLSEANAEVLFIQVLFPVKEYKVGPDDTVILHSC